MTTERESEIVRRALDWHRREPELDEQEWQLFIAWLEEAPDHAEAYDRIAAEHWLLARQETPLSALLTRDEPPPPAANDDPPTKLRWALPALGAAVAAALVLSLMRPAPQPSRPETYLVRTEPGQRRTVKLAAGTRIELNGRTLLRLDRADPRFAALEEGEAVFTVRHDPARPFTLRSGNATVTDLGTIFDVRRAGSSLEVGVSQGAAALDTSREVVKLAAGDRVALGGNGAIARTRLPVDDIGAWRSGRYRFRDESLASIAAVLARDYAIPVALEGDLPGRRFTGTVQFSGDARRDVAHLAAMAGVEWRRSGDHWIFSPPPAGSH